VTETRKPDEGAISEVPWALVFDPAVNARALGEIQARGFRAAAGLVDRFVTRADRSQPAAQESAPAAERTENPSAARIPDVDLLLESWRVLIGQLAGSVRGNSSRQASSAAAFDFVNSAASGELTLAATQPGTVDSEVWLHNSGSVDRGDICLRCGDLLSHDGSVIGSARISFEPEVVPMPARCSRGVLVHIEVGADAAPGRYHGMLLADGHPDIWLPIMLDVEFAPE
jgi:hypothetical protein